MHPWGYLPIQWFDRWAESVCLVLCATDPQPKLTNLFLAYLLCWHCSTHRGGAFPFLYLHCWIDLGKIPVTGFKKLSCQLATSPNNFLYLSVKDFHITLMLTLLNNVSATFSFRLYSIVDPTWVDFWEHICHRFQKFLRSSDPELKLPNTDLTLICF